MNYARLLKLFTQEYAFVSAPIDTFEKGTQQEFSFGIQDNNPSLKIVFTNMHTGPTFAGSNTYNKLTTIVQQEPAQQHRDHRTETRNPRRRLLSVWSGDRTANERPHYLRKKTITNAK